MKPNEYHKTATVARLPYSQLLAFGMGGLIPIALFNIAGQLMPLLGNTGLGLSAFWLGIIMIIPRLWDAFSDPMMGHISDNAQTPWGRRRPFILIGSIAVAISFVAMWWGPEEAGNTVKLSYIFLWMLIFFTATTIFEIPHGALGMEMVKEPHLRTQLFSAKSFFGNMFALGTPWLIWLSTREVFCGVGGNEIDGMRWVSMLIAVLLIPMGVWWFLSLKEPPIQKEKLERVSLKKDMVTTLSNRTFLLLVVIFFILAMGFNFVALLNYYISMFFLYGGDKVSAGTLLGINGTVWAITGLLAVFPLNVIGPKLGKQKTLALAILLMCAAQLSKILCYNPQLPYLVIIPTIFLSAGMLMFFTLGPSMLGDLCDEVELKTGRRTDGSFYAVFWWFIKMGTACASLVTGVLITVSTFDEQQPRLMDAVIGPLRELSVVGMVEQAGINFNVMTIAVLLLLSGLFLAVYAVKAFRLQGRKFIVLLLACAALMASGGALGRQQLMKSTKEPVPVNLAEKLTATFEAVVSVDEYLEGRETAGGRNAGHYAGLRELLSEIRGKTEALLTAHKSDALALERVRDDSVQMIDLALDAMQQSPTAMYRLRVIEISLPLIMSLLSLFLVFRYPLTEERVYENKRLLEERNNEKTDNTEEVPT